MVNHPPISPPGRRNSGELSKLLVSDLQRIAEELGISNTGRMRKGDLVAAIQERIGGQRAGRAGKSGRAGRSSTTQDMLDPRTDLSGEDGVQRVLDYLYRADQQLIAESVIALRRGARAMLGRGVQRLDLFGEEGVEKFDGQWDVLANYAERALPGKSVNRAIIDAFYDPVWRKALAGWARQNVDLLGEDALGGTPAFEHIADLDLKGYVEDFARSSTLNTLLAAGRLPFSPALPQRSRNLALLAARIWRITNADSPMLNQLLEVDEVLAGHLPANDEKKVVPQKRTVSSLLPQAQSSPQAKGARLERSVLDIFKHLFRFEGDEVNRLQLELRRQQSGTQFGTDIIFRAVAADSNSTCLVECKNYSSREISGLPVSVVSDKLLQAEAAFDAEPVDHWILISPHVDPSNELDRLIKRWNWLGKFPFEVQIWSPQNGVQDLFATAPEIYKGLYGEDPPQLRDPNGVLARFSERLLPPIRLSRKLDKYIKDDSSFVERTELAWLDQLNSQIERFGFDERGARLSGTLQDEVLSVLFGAPRGPNAVLLLADFGEGKSFFTVSLCARLRSRYLEEPRPDSPIPIRFFLRGYRHVSAPMDFIRGQLEKIGLNMEDWAELRKRNILIILDGLDEMSVQQDPETTRSNLDKVGSLLEELAGFPVLVTSRPHFFSSGPDRERFYDRLRRPRVFRMGQPDRRETVAHLRTYAESLGLDAKLNKIKELYDPIGLAGKVLFLEMIKTTLPDLPEDRFDEIILYKTYVKSALERKVSLLRDSGSTLQDDDLLGQLEILLEKIAIEIHVTGEGSVDLRKFASKSGGAAQLLWKASQLQGVGPGEEEDASARIGSRSLLRRVGFEPGREEESWHVDFFHRSMKEYFVAKAFWRALKSHDPFVETRRLLVRASMQPEILGFFKLLSAGDADICIILASLVHSARTTSKQGLLGGGAISLYYAAGGSFSESDWRSLNLDGALLGGANLSDSDFRESTLRSADLSSADLTGADLRYSDLSNANLNAGGSIIALSSDRMPQRYLCLTQECSIGKISVKSDDSLQFSHISLPLDLRWPESLYLLAEDVLLITGRAEALIVEIGDGRVEEICHFRVSNDIRSVAVLDRALLGLLIETEFGMSEAILIDIETGNVSWRTWVTPGGSACSWSSESVAITYGSEIVLYQMEGRVSGARANVIATNLAVLGQSLALSGDHLVAASDNGVVSILRMDDSTQIDSFQAHSGAGTAIVAANGEILSAGTDGSIALARQGKDRKLKLVSRLERRFRCAEARVDGLTGVREREIFSANGAVSY